MNQYCNEENNRIPDRLRLTGLPVPQAPGLPQQGPPAGAQPHVQVALEAPQGGAPQPLWAACARPRGAA